MKARRHIKDTLDKAPYLGEKFHSCVGIIEFTKLRKNDESVGLKTCDYCALNGTSQCEDAECWMGYRLPGDTAESEMLGYYKTFEKE